MKQFIDFGEPEPIYPQGFMEKANKCMKILTERYDSPWEEFDRIKQAIYSVRMVQRHALILNKNNWPEERNKEINLLRKALYYTIMKAIGNSYDV